MSNLDTIASQLSKPMSRTQLARVYKLLKDQNPQAAELVQKITNDTDLFTIVAGEDKLVSKEEIEKLARLHGSTPNVELTQEDLDTALKLRSLVLPPPPKELPKPEPPPPPQKTNLQIITEHAGFAQPLSITDLSDLAEKIKANNADAARLLEEIINDDNLLSVIDKNGDGKISKEEITELAKLTGDPNKPELDLFDLLKATNIGLNRKINELLDKLQKLNQK